jgi:hypothetical protein
MAFPTISNLAGSIALGARPNLFQVSFASGLATDFTQGINSNFSYLCKAAQLPGSSMGIIDVPVIGGRRYKINGERTFADWTVTVMNDGAYASRTAIEAYQRLFVGTDYSLTTYGARDTLTSVVTVQQLNTAGGVTKTYNLINCWPSDISTIDLSYDSTDSLEEFTVTWTYDYFTVGTATATTAAT